MFAIRQSADGPYLCVGYRTLSAAVAALERLRATSTAYQSHVVVATPPEETP